MRKLVVGILAHVDAGKTTLAEGILYQTGSIRSFGRVDHKNAFLDNYELERERGITIFSKQAVLTYKDIEITLLDTPGHVDFSAEMERTLQVLDYAILVISGSEGVQGHTETLWRLLLRYNIPVFIFINKMDLEGTDRQKLTKELKGVLSEGCVDFSDNQDPILFMENLAVCDENLLHYYIEHGKIETDDIAKLIYNRKAYPCYFGSALKQDGLLEFLDGLREYTLNKKYPEEFSARVYKIARDDQGNRLTYMKITGGSLKVKMSVTNRKAQLMTDMNPNDIWEEKVNQIRIYSGSRYENLDEINAGAVCAVTGLTKTYPGEGLGIEEDLDMAILKPVLTYQLLLPPETNAFQMLLLLREMEEEDPTLHIIWYEQLQEIHVQLMGVVQIEILISLISERFGLEVEFGPGNILYKETIGQAVVGVGHFEPLRHYAEVHLLMEPQEAGTGLIFESKCSEDILDRNWQRLILTHLEEKEHIGVLTGSPITDMKITLILGRAHLKHTEGGDFRQATYRAIRQGLRKTENVLLEPYYHFKLEAPSDNIGRAMSDIQNMKGSFEPPLIEGDKAILTGNAPVATMGGYQTEVNAYTRGRGSLFCTLAGYQPCHNEEEVIEKIGYNSELDSDNPTGSVFCTHGAGFIVAWDQVENYMHIENSMKELYPDKIKSENPDTSSDVDFDSVLNQESLASKPSKILTDSWQEDKELEEIFSRTFGPVKQSAIYTPSRLGYEKNPNLSNPSQERDEQYKKGNKSKVYALEYLLVDGYNIIFSWEELNELAKANMDAARYRLMDILSNYQGFRKCKVILVFDAYKVKGGVGSIQKYHNIDVVYTKEAETADQYIEKVTHEIARDNHVTVATSDALEQLIILGKGANRLSANDFKDEILRVNNTIREDYLEKHCIGRANIGDQFGDDVIEYIEEDK
ncbi:MAG: TetM/TetW/TetO/TetS family tetracycline resistance ribosomal protection protein [Herbinix sp.]|nr:TetM/TetW/TetO/TetS family tetracycline resistance ribosomal protection protein [Herbinix sp.]